MALKADVFIPASKHALALKTCLDSLKTQSVKDFRVIVVAKKDNEEIRQLIKKYNLKIDYYIQEGYGLVGAANTALKKAKTSIFIRIDDDVSVSKNWLKAILETFRNESKIAGVTGPTLLSPQGLKSRDSISYFTSTPKNIIVSRFLGKLYYGYIMEGKALAVSRFFKSGAFSIGSNFKKSLLIKPREVENLEACNFAVKAKYILKFGGFDRTFERGLGEYHEADLAMKIRSIGKKIIFNPKAYVNHNIELDPPMVRTDSYNRIKNFIIFYKRHIGVKSLDYFFRFMSNIIFQNAYYIYKFVKTGKLDLLGSIPGTISGLFYKGK